MPTTQESKLELMRPLTSIWMTYMVFDNNAGIALDFFGELLFKHYTSESSPRPEFKDSEAADSSRFYSVECVRGFRASG